MLIQASDIAAFASAASTADNANAAAHDPAKNEHGDRYASLGAKDFESYLNANLKVGIGESIENDPGLHRLGNRSVPDYSFDPMTIPGAGRCEWMDCRNVFQDFQWLDVRDNKALQAAGIGLQARDMFDTSRAKLWHDSSRSLVQFLRQYGSVKTKHGGSG